MDQWRQIRSLEKTQMLSLVGSGIKCHDVSGLALLNLLSNFARLLLSELVV